MEAKDRITPRGRRGNIDPRLTPNQTTLPFRLRQAAAIAVAVAEQRRSPSPTLKYTLRMHLVHEQTGAT